MSIIAIEGPDKCGKSTLFAKLRDADLLFARFTDVPPYGLRRMRIASELALRDLELWEALYDPKTLYVCNRHVIISDAVYSALYKRPRLRASILAASIGVVYIDVPTDELARRHEECAEDVQGRDDYDRVKRQYRTVLQYFHHTVITADYDLYKVASSIEELARDLV